MQIPGDDLEFASRDPPVEHRTPVHAQHPAHVVEHASPVHGSALSRIATSQDGPAPPFGTNTIRTPSTGDCPCATAHAVSDSITTNVSASLSCADGLCTQASR